MVEYAIVESKCIGNKTSDNVVNLTLYTIELNKQVLVFNNSKRSSEATAERIANAISNVENKNELEIISNKILKSLSNPTKQCKRLAKIVKLGVAFHHSGLVAKQRNLIEKGFKKGVIKVISSTPTLAAGLNLPAYKVIIKDYKRYSNRGMSDIPILEYHQMSGRAGRPGKEDIGKAVLCIPNDSEKDRVIPKYIFGKPEEIISKLAMEPTLKMYLLSLISMDIINTKIEIKTFFSNTLYATQYGDLEDLFKNIFKILDTLKNYNFINQDDDYYIATRIGKKISELYLNPDTANFFIENFEDMVKLFSKQNISKFDIFSLIHFFVNTMEMKPLFRVNKIEEEYYISKLEELSDKLLFKFDPFEQDYEVYLSSLKTTELFIDWISEAPEDYIMEKYKVTPGELNYKLGILDWLIYSISEIAILKKNIFFKNFLSKFRIRFKNGIHEELIPLIDLKYIGRVRARRLYSSGLKSISDLRSVNLNVIIKVVGENIAKKIKEQLDDEKFNSIENQAEKKPYEIKVRDVSDYEVEKLINTYKEFEKEKRENKSLTDFF